MPNASDFDTWAADVARELASLGMPVLEAKHVPYDDEEWFRGLFEAGESASMTAYDWLNNN